MHVEEFHHICIQNKPDFIVQRFIIESPSYFFAEILKDDEFDFKRDLASLLRVHVRDIVIVGSSKLGFSLKPDRTFEKVYRFKEFDCDVNDGKKSDLDVAVISSTLFDEELKNLYEHTGYHRTTFQYKHEFAKYILKGRFAVRYLPPSFSMSRSIKNVQKKYRRMYGRTVNIEIYKSWYFFETYHCENIRNIQINIMPKE